MSSTDTIAAVATPPGRGGIGVVRVSGPDTRSLIQALCGHALVPRRAQLCHFQDDDGSTIDQGIALYFPAPNSYTGESVLELQGHGGPVVMQRLLRRCLALGARMAAPGEFTQRAFLNGKLDLAQAEGVADLIDAATEQAAKAASRSIQGEFSAEVHGLAAAILELRALTEATLDFPEEDIDAGTRTDQARRLVAVQAQLLRLLKASQQGSLLRDGARVVLAGRPNVGKSSLLNRLAGDDIAIVTEIPGTTRDTIRQTISLQGVPVHIIDTAGLRDASDPVEQIGIGRTWAAIADADVAVMVLDATQGETAEDRAILAKLPGHLRCIHAINKCDLAGLAEGRSLQAKALTVVLSAKTGAGMPDFAAAMADAIGWRGDGEGVFMARARHLEALRQTEVWLNRAQAEQARPELFAEELRRAHEALMSITGEVSADDLLGHIFSRFCIGK